jgi:pimeloyl-ACP methyl ester carboxylesterase
MLWNYLGASADKRKKMLIGSSFSESFLEVDDETPASNASPLSDGFQGLMDDYRPFLLQLKTRDWGLLSKLFVFPVYGFAYNWTASNFSSGKKLAARIEAVIQEARSITGLCSKVILLTHSMGGLVARSAAKLHGSEGNILGIVHSVQPASGAPAAYWRMKAGFEGSSLPASVLGNDGLSVTAMLANSPGGLELLPNQHYRTGEGKIAWLRGVRDLDGVIRDQPKKGDPYSDIYAVPAVTEPPAGTGPSSNRYWGLVDPALLDPSNQLPRKPQATARTPDALDGADPGPQWPTYLGLLNIAKNFHASLGEKRHPGHLQFCRHRSRIGRICGLSRNAIFIHAAR